MTNNDESLFPLCLLSDVVSFHFNRSVFLSSMIRQVDSSLWGFFCLKCIYTSSTHKIHASKKFINMTYTYASLIFFFLGWIEGNFVYFDLFIHLCTLQIILHFRKRLLWKKRSFGYSNFVDFHKVLFVSTRYKLWLGRGIDNSIICV